MKLGDDIPNVDFSNRPAFRAIREGGSESVFGEFTGVAGKDQFIASMGGKGAKFIVTAGWDASKALAHWRNVAMVIGIFTLGGISTIIVLFVYLAKVLRRNDELLTEVSQGGGDLRDLVAAMPDAVLVIDEGLKIVFANPAAERLYGYNRGEMDNLALRDTSATALGSTDEQGIRRALTAINIGPTLQAAERISKRKDGSTFPVEISSCSYKSKNAHFLVTAHRDITKRKADERVVRRSRENLSRAQRIAGLGSFERDLLTGEVQRSDEFLRIWGIPEQPSHTALELLVNLIHPEDRQKFMAEREAVLSGNPLPPQDFRIIRPDGDERIFHYEYGVDFGENEKPVRLFGTVQDVTRRRKIEGELRRSRESMVRAQRIAGLGSFERDSVTGRLNWSDEMYRILGIAPGELASLETLVNLIHPDDRCRFIDDSKDKGEGRSAHSGEYRILRPDGVERIVRAEAVITLDENKHEIRRDGTLQDITDQKNTESELRRSRENLIRAQRIARTGSFERDFITGKIEWSDGMYDLLGIKKGAALPGPETLIKLVHPDDREKFLAYRKGELSGNTIMPIEYRIMRPDGKERIVHRESNVVFDERKRPIHLYGTLQDITEQRLAEHRKLELERQLLHSQKLEALGTLASGIAHDLNNTLVPIMALSKLGARRLEAGNPLRSNLETIFEASERARDLVKRVLTFSRKSTSEKQESELSEVVGEALKLLRATIPASIELETRIANVPAIRADTSQIHQVVTNLVANAAAAIGDQMGKIKITLAVISGSSPRRELCLTIADTGMGMDEGTQARIFEPFFTTKRVGEGTGLGLSIVHGIVIDHGGRIEVKSEPGKGTRFDIYLPVPEPDSAVAAQYVIASSLPAA